MVKEKYLVICEYERIWNDFYSSLMGDKPEAMDEFCSTYENSEITGFVKSVKKDIAPIKNAISFELNSGFVEGGNCKYKSTKRLMYGRAEHDHFYLKTYL